MSQMIKNIFAVFLLGTLSITVTAETKLKATTALVEKISDESINMLIIEVQKSGKSPDREHITKTVMNNIRNRIAEFRNAFAEDCASEYGKEKLTECNCAAEKADFETLFAVLEKQILEPQASLEEETRKQVDNFAQVEKACNL